MSYRPRIHHLDFTVYIPYSVLRLKTVWLPEIWSNAEVMLPSLSLGIVVINHCARLSSTSGTSRGTLCIVRTGTRTRGGNNIPSLFTFTYHRSIPQQYKHPPLVLCLDLHSPLPQVPLPVFIQSSVMH